VAHDHDDDRADGHAGDGGGDGHTDTAELPSMGGGLGEGADDLGLLEDPAPSTTTTQSPTTDRRAARCSTRSGPSSPVNPT
jgi:hypothetical protein